MSIKLPKYIPPSPYVPFLRRFTDERAIDLAETQALYRDVTAKFRASTWSSEDVITNLNAVIAAAVGDIVTVPSFVPFCAALDACQMSLLQLENTLFTTATISDWSILSLREQVDLRRYLRAQEHFLGNDDRVIKLLHDAIGSISSGIIASLPSMLDEKSPFTVPLYTLLDAHDVVDRIIGTLSTAEHDNAGIFATVNDRIYRNICAASKLVPFEDHKRPFITARDSELPAEELIDTYLGGTPFIELLSTPVPFSIPREKYKMHTAIFAPSGHGKTQLLQQLIIGFLEEDDPPGMFIVDSQDAMLQNIQRLEVFSTRLKDRLVVLDPPEPALNFFQLGDINDIQTQELAEYLFSAIERTLTAKQSTPVPYLLKLLRQIPDANLHTLRKIMGEQLGRAGMEASAYYPYIAKLDELSQDFLRNQFYDKEMAGTRKQVEGRLFKILGNDNFNIMFAATENRFNAFQAMQEKKIVLINTAHNKLGSDGATVFGRFMIAQVLRAAYQRDPNKNNPLTLLILDEAHEYFDEMTETILRQARKYSVGLIVATQLLGKMPEGVRASLMGTTAIKFAGPVPSADAQALSREMYTTHDFIRSMQGFGNFACYVAGMSSAVQLSIPYGTLESQPRMDEDTWRAMRAANRERYASPPASAAAPLPSAPPPVPPGDPSDFADRY